MKKTAMKLIKGNVEANPGPANMVEFLGFMYTDAEDAAIKLDGLNDFKAANDKETNLKKLKTKNT